MDMRARARWLLRAIRANGYGGLCEELGGYDNVQWRELLFKGGDVRVTSAHEGIFVDGEQLDYAGVDMSVVRLAHYDLDYINLLYAQVWDHKQAEPEWVHVLFVNRAQNHWVPECIEAFEGRPTFAAVGALVDEWCGWSTTL